MKNLLFLILLFFGVTSYGQNDEEPQLQRVISLSMLPPGLSYESPLSDNLTAYIYSGLGFTYYVEEVSGEKFVEYYFKPFITGQVRYFYNLKKRSLLKKNTDFNSGSYLALMANYTFRPINEKDILSYAYHNRRGISLGPVWGMQRNGAFSFGFSLGLGFQIYEQDNYTFNTNGIEKSTVSDSEFRLIGSINLGLNLSRLAKGKN